MVGLAGVISVVCLALFALQVALPAAHHLTNGFSAYDTAARLVVAGEDAARFYDDAWFQAQTVRLGFGSAPDIFNLNPPAAALLLVPLAGLAPGPAKAVWTGLNLVFVGLALVGLGGLGRGSWLTTALALAALTFFQPLRAEIRQGQAYALLLALEVGLCRAHLAGRAAGSGVSLGLMLAFKAAGLAFPALLLGQRCWRALAWTALAVVGVIVLSSPWLGLGAWLTYATLLRQGDAHPELAVPAYQSLPGFWLHLLHPDPTWNPAPLLARPDLVGPLLLASTLALVGPTFWLTGRADPADRAARALAFAAWAILSVVLSPAAADYHYTLLLAPIALLLSQAQRRGGEAGPRLIVVVGILLVGAPLPLPLPRLAEGGEVLLAYPKLVGALLLWAVAVAGLAGRRGYAVGAARAIIEERREANPALGRSG